MKSLLFVLHFASWVMTGLSIGFGVYIIIDMVFLSSSPIARVVSVDNPQLYIIQRVNNERSSRHHHTFNTSYALTQLANTYTLEYRANNSLYPIASNRLIYDLYLQNYFIGDVIHQIHGMILEPISETSLNSVFERTKIYLNDDLNDIGVSILVNDDGTFYYMILLGGQEKLTSPYAHPSFVGEYSQDGQQNAIVTMLNNARSERGLPLLRLNQTLMRVAYNHSVDQAQRNRMGHDGSNGSSPHSRIFDAGYTGISTGENVLVRPTAYAAGAFNQWWNSITHLETMMHPGFTEIGVAWALSSNGNYYYTMALGG